MVVGFYNPYQQTLGGGEYYLFCMMQEFLPTHTVIYYSDQADCLAEAERRFDLKLQGVRVVPAVFLHGNHVTKLQATAGLDKLFWYSDGSLPLSLAKQTYLVFQFPVPWVKLGIMSRFKLQRITQTLVNSEFTKQSIDKTFRVKSAVLYPGVKTAKFANNIKKQPLILSVGRFTQGMNTKRHDVSIQAFKALVDRGLTGWRLVIAGGVAPFDQTYYESLKIQTKDYPIECLDNISQDQLFQLYEHAAIYWHAAGYQVDSNQHPESVEHFGIAVVEAMAAGAYPLVYAAGGPAEIVNHQPEYLFTTIDELIQKTEQRITLKPVSAGQKVLDLAERFTLEKFRQHFADYVKV